MLLNVEVWSRERFILRLCMEMGSLCTKNSKHPKGFQGSIYKDKGREEGRVIGSVICCAQFSDWLMLR